MRNNRFRDALLEPEKFFRGIFEVISLPKVIAFVLVALFFANLGSFLYEERSQAIKSNFPEVESIQSPFTETDERLPSPHQLFGVPIAQREGNPLAQSPDARGVFEQRTKRGLNLPPIARARVVSTSLAEGFYTGDTVFLSAADSYDPDGFIKERRWDFDISNGLGIDAEGVNVTARYNTPGMYTISLTTIDERGAQSSTTMVIHVQREPEEKTSAILPGITTNKIDLDALLFTSRIETQSAVENAFAGFQANAVATLSQAIFNSQRRRLPALPTLSEIEMVVGKDPSNVPPVIDSVSPKDGAEVWTRKPLISAGFYGNNEIDLKSIELLVNGVPVTADTMRNRFGIQYRPSEELALGDHHAMLVVSDSRGLRTARSWRFNIGDPSAGSDGLVPRFVDDEGPEIIMHFPGVNAKNVRTNSEIRVSYDEPANPDSVQVAIVNLSDNVTRLFAGTQIEWNASNTAFVVRSLSDMFKNDQTYQVVVRQEDVLGNESFKEWFLTTEKYVAPILTVTSPANNSTVNRPEVVVTGSAQRTYSISVAGRVAMVDAQGVFTATISLQRGENTIKITAEDLQGRRSEQDLIVTFDPHANDGNPIIAPLNSPVILDASIRDGDVVDQVRPQIFFSFASSNEIDQRSVRLLLNDRDVTGLSMVSRDSVSYRPLEPLSQGRQTVQVVISDKKGNTTNYSMSFMVDAYPDRPNQLVASLSGNNENVFLIWNAVTNFPNPEYRVFRSVSPNVTTTVAHEVARGLRTTNWTDTSVLDGTTYFYVVAAVSADGVVGTPSREVSIRVDFSAPVLRILSPEQTTTTISQRDTVIRGVTERGSVVTVYVNHVRVGTPTIASDSTFQQSVSLANGENVITVVAKDSDGNESTQVLSITYQTPDTVSPAPVTSAPRGTQVSVNSAISVTYNEPINPSSFTLRLRPSDSTQGVIPVTINDIALQASEDKRTFTFQPHSPLEYLTRYRIEIEARDLSGNISRDDDWEFETSSKAAPVLTIATPLVNFVSDTESITVSGSTETGARVVVSVNGVPQGAPVTAQVNGQFAQIVRLRPGLNAITVVSTDRLNNSSMLVREVTYDAEDNNPPTLTVSSPEQNAVLHTPSIPMEGHAEVGSSVSIVVNGKAQGSVSVQANGFFSHQVTLLSGVNLVVATATDSSGNETRVTRIVTLDRQGPLLVVANPTNNLRTNQVSVEVRGITDRAGSSVSVNVNGADVGIVPVLQDGSFAVWVSLGVGNNMINTTARDNFGNETRDHKTVFFDPVGGVHMPPTSGGGGGSGSTAGMSSPSISGLPQSGTATAERIFTVEGVTQPESQVAIHQNGIPIYGGQSDINSGAFATNTTLREGQNIFTVSSTSEQGERVVTTTVVMLDTTGPSVNIMSPKEGASLNSGTIVVHGITEPGSRIVAEKDGSTGETISSDLGFFTTEVRAGSDGAGHIFVQAFDPLGNESLTRISIVMDRTSPELSLISLSGRSLSQFVTETPGGGVVVINATNGTISGRTESDAMVQVFGNERLVGSTRADTNGDFRVAVSVNPVEVNNIRVEASDSLGNQTNRFFRVFGDAEGPVLFFYTPSAARDIRQGVLTLSGMAADASFPVVVRVSLNDEQYTPGLIPHPPHRTVVTTSSPGVFSLPIDSLVRGTNRLTIMAEDSAGNSSVYTLGVLYEENAGEPLMTLNVVHGPSTRHRSIASALAVSSQNVSPVQPQDPNNTGRTFGAYGQFFLLTPEQLAVQSITEEMLADLFDTALLTDRVLTPAFYDSIAPPSRELLVKMLERNLIDFLVDTFRGGLFNFSPNLTARIDVDVRIKVRGGAFPPESIPLDRNIHFATVPASQPVISCTVTEHSGLRFGVSADFLNPSHVDSIFEGSVHRLFMRNVNALTPASVVRSEMTRSGTDAEGEYIEYIYVGHAVLRCSERAH